MSIDPAIASHNQWIARLASQCIASQWSVIADDIVVVQRLDPKAPNYHQDMADRMRSILSAAEQIQQQVHALARTIQ